MNTLIKEDRLCVISDIHFGNPSFTQGRGLNSFLDHLLDKKTSLCINGDGLDLLQMSFPKLMLDFPTIISSVTNYLSGGKNKVYYVVGNHDIYMETFLESAGVFNVVPFLDVVSGNQRIHIEHGHLYDRFFLYYPNLYTQLTKFAGLWLRLAPNFFHLWDKSMLYMASLKNRRHGEQANPLDKHIYIKAAGGLFDRGFDTVIFGHTHNPGIYKLDVSKRYANTGSWIGTSGYYIEIDKGEISLREWKE